MVFGYQLTPAGFVSQITLPDSQLTIHDSQLLVPGFRLRKKAKEEKKSD
jgi:hypothetical protein